MSLVVSNGGGQSSGSAPELLVNWAYVTLWSNTSTTIYTASQSCKLYCYCSASNQMLYGAFNRNADGGTDDFVFIADSYTSVVLRPRRMENFVAYHPTIVSEGLCSFDLNENDYLSIMWAGSSSTTISFGYCVYTR